MRYQRERPPEIVDLGIRLTDVTAYALESESVVYKKSDPTANLCKNGATDEEIAFLVRERHSRGGSGERVELNALTSRQFVDWLEGKLREHQVAKVIPDAATLERSWRRAR